MIEVCLKIDGMKCSMCESHVNDVVRKSCKVIKVSSSHVKNETKIVLENLDNLDLIIQNIEKDGYRVLSHEKYEVKKTLFGYKRI